MVVVAPQRPMALVVLVVLAGAVCDRMAPAVLEHPIKEVMEAKVVVMHQCHSMLAEAAVEQTQ